MTPLTVAVRAVRHNWRSHLPAALFVALATAIITGALEVQTSIQATLRSALTHPLGRATEALATDGTFRANLAGPGDEAALVLSSTASGGSSDNSVPAMVWGLDSSASSLFDVWTQIAPGSARVSGMLARELGLSVGSRLFLRIPNPNAAPLMSLFGRWLARQASREVSVEVAEILPQGGIADLSMSPVIGEKAQLFVDREWLCNEMGTPSCANLILGPDAKLAERVARRMSVRDFGLSILTRQGESTIRSNRVVLTSGQLSACRDAAKACGAIARFSTVALAEEVECGHRQISYAMVAALGNEPRVGQFELNDWAATALGASVGQTVRLTLMAPKPDGGTGRVKVAGQVVRILPMAGDGANPSFVPQIAGMTDSATMSEWNTPFPVNLSRVTPADEAYWRRYRAAPKVFVDSAVPQMAWGDSGAVTAVVISGGRQDLLTAALLKRLTPDACGMSVVSLRENALRAASGSADLAGLELGLSSFLIFSALGLAATLLLLNLQSRSKERLLMSYVGLPRRVIGSLILCELAIVSGVGALMGVLGGPLLAQLSLTMLARWMPSFMALNDLRVTVDSGDMAIGLLAGLLCSLAAALIAMRVPIARKARRMHPRVRVATGAFALIFRSICYRPLRPLSVALIVAASTSVLGIAAASLSSAVGDETGYALQVETAMPVAIDWGSAEGRKRLRFDPNDEPLFQGVTVTPLLRSSGTDASCLNPAKPIQPRLAAVNTDMPGTGLLAVESVALPFPIMGRQNAGTVSDERSPQAPNLSSPRASESRRRAMERSGIGKGSVSQIPPKGNERSESGSLSQRSGDPAEGTWSEAESGRTGPASRSLGEGWRGGESETVPAIGDADTIEWILGSKVGGTYDLALQSGRSVHLKFVGATHGTSLPGDLLVSREAFRPLFPDIDAPTLFLAKVPAGRVAAVQAAIARNLGDYGVTVKTTESILRSLHQVQNAYLSIFLVFGSLGLFLGICGSGLAIARNAAERRSEFVLMSALGIPRVRVASFIAAETYLAVLAGALLGFAISAGVGSLERSDVSWAALAVATLVILAAATATCVAVSSLFLRKGTLEALRSE